MKQNRSIFIEDRALAHSLGGLLSVLESLLPIRICTVSDVDVSSPMAGIISTVSFGRDGPAPRNTPRLELPPAEPGREALSITSLRFSESATVPLPFRGRLISVHATVDAESCDSMARSAGPEILATDQEGRPVWTIEKVDAVAIHRTALCSPDAPAGTDVGMAVDGERFIQALPLFHFLRALTRAEALTGPRLRACYVIDDPNLHWPNYGYVNYREIAESARRHRFHVAFATIPLDSWWVHGSTADTFRKNRQSLSLLVHGNNHARQELAQDVAREDCAALLQQAIVRTRRLEKKAGLQVSRVMVPPHGACSSRMLAELPRQGFESACISSGSLRAHNIGQAWTKSLGIAPSELVHGCPVLPRWAFAATSDASLLVAAYLDKPLILRGHHQDLKQGLDVLRRFADTINSIGPVHWGSLSELSRLNFRHRVEGSVMWLQPLGTHVRVAVPEGVDEVRIQPSGFEWDSPEARTHTGASSGERVLAVEGRRDYSLIRRTADIDLDVNPGRRLPTSPKLILRRVLTETRDRLRVA